MTVNRLVFENTTYIDKTNTYGAGEVDRNVLVKNIEKIFVTANLQRILRAFEGEFSVVKPQHLRNDAQKFALSTLVDGHEWSFGSNSSHPGLQWVHDVAQALSGEGYSGVPLPRLLTTKCKPLFSSFCEAANWLCCSARPASLLKILLDNRVR